MFGSKRPKIPPLLTRCREDALTRLRLKYDLYYHSFDAQQGMRVRSHGRERVLLCSNDYLGLAWHPEVKAAAAEALARWGSSTNGSRLANGSRSFHAELESALASHLGKEACQVSAAGYLSCLAAINAFAGKGDIVIADRSIHACMWDGIRLSGAQAERFAHNDPADLRRVLEALDPEAPKLLAIEGVYSMEGDIAPLPALLDVAEAHNCLVVLDDAHGLGVLGTHGRGTADHLGVTDRVHLICGSLSKSLASTGGFIAGERACIEHLRTHSRQSIFSAALSAPQAAAATAALRVSVSEPAHRERLWRNTSAYRALLEELGVDTWGSRTPAIPLVMGSKERAYFLWKALLDRDVFTVLSTSPAVPAGRDLVRTALSAAHSDADLELVFKALKASI